MRYSKIKLKTKNSVNRLYLDPIRISEVFALTFYPWISMVGKAKRGFFLLIFWYFLRNPVDIIIVLYYY